ncbi:DUF998 domain-containing protein [Curtobacterium flaccumfaciens]|uniref:DUF998 domain-containing protein n=1 Tax=Curtobacterium flaccumfaciens TaxID=2035 RepID=UPI0019D442E5|nr:DUF998 domain-containing protein [Curtobacterium flaccumfaciens]MCS0647078.1 DUF998 domain-containing protein [Curtobacterium flaccumfaciens pv. flaccumfaciens]MCS6524673.1 DUF998 domain-containing protein [Curtobacterium flaccumfaciens pv. flaccumfaciens]MCS6529819.1 DUF998 domain-containing protein [Curtobacterium flaccumfaciens pv. flaccumfaciens]MCS6588328.1 DUF998 domain-containing protein [Curtobacterium flaccumfaciens pv. flaccumfaciens]
MPIIRSGAALRAGAVLLLAGPLVSWLAEFITAAAWQHPHYAPLYNWVSHLGLTGPRQVAFGQVGNSPLGAVMDAGWVLYGVSLIVGTLLTFDVRRGGRAAVIVVVGIIAGIGVSLVGMFQGSNANVASGLINFHQFGAQGVIIAGNIMAILVGAAASRIGLPRARGTLSVLLGIFGLAMFVVFMADVFTGWAFNIGMFERGAIYPIMVGHVLLGSGIFAAHFSPARTTRKTA